MTAIDAFIYFIGFSVLAWWLIGVVAMAFFAKVYVHPGTPFIEKAITAGVSGFIIPWAMLTRGVIPMILLHPQEMTEADTEQVRNWLAQHCDCPSCKRRSGRA